MCAYQKLSQFLPGQRQGTFEYQRNDRFVRILEQMHGDTAFLVWTSFFIFGYFFLFVAFSEPAFLYEESTNKDEVSFIIIVLEAVFVLLHISKTACNLHIRQHLYICGGVCEYSVPTFKYNYLLMSMSIFNFFLF